MLNTYLTNTQNLLQLPSAPNTLYSQANLTTWINSARNQLAGEGECIRVLATMPLVTNTNVYGFSSITVSGISGVSGVLNARQIFLSGGNIMLQQWPWEYFSYFYLANTSLAAGTPTSWSQYAQGVNGSLYFSPTPSATVTANIDTICYPVALVTDATPEAIPYPWTDAVPYFAAYLALLSAQSAGRQADANRMFERYTEFVKRARQISTPAVTPFQYEQSGIRIPVSPAGVSPPSQQGAG